jgi:hypothetical protein
MDNQEKSMLENLQKIFININKYSTCYKYNEKCDLLYDFLTKDDEHEYDSFIENIDEIDEYKNMIILNLCTDFYIASNYRIKKGEMDFNYEKDIFETLDSKHTPAKITSFFKNKKNQFEAEIIIENYFDLLIEDEFYIKKCINCAINTNKVFKIMVMNPFASIRYCNFNIPKLEIIRDEIFELYVSSVNKQTKEIFDKRQNDDTKSNECIEELNSPEATKTLYENLKKEILNAQSYLGKMNKIIAYIISSAYERMRLSTDKKFQRIVDYIENKSENLEEVIEVFINNNDFSNIILYEFIKDYSLYNPEYIIKRRNLYEESGYNKLLKNINPFYDIESEECHKKLKKSISSTDTQHHTK